MSLPSAITPETSEPALIRIPAGWFLMGSDAGQDNERPVHRVWVDSFELSPYQVTNAEYAAFLRAGESSPPPLWFDDKFSDPEQPVVSVSWFEASTYCEWLGARFGRRYRLPTEAEWERAARAGVEQKLFPWGEGSPEDVPDYSRRWKTGPEQVGRYAPNPYGLYNLGDNVHEWCSDWFGADYYTVSPERNPRGPATGERRSSRGGSWRHHVKVTRCAARSSIPPHMQYADYGFRVACDVE
jgi:formylglycine-generating enzyme required for sulfatase activity